MLKPHTVRGQFSSSFRVRVSLGDIGEKSGDWGGKAENEVRTGCTLSLHFTESVVMNISPKVHIPSAALAFSSPVIRRTMPPEDIQISRRNMKRFCWQSPFPLSEVENGRVLIKALDFCRGLAAAHDIDIVFFLQFIYKTFHNTIFGVSTLKFHPNGSRDSSLSQLKGTT